MICSLHIYRPRGIIIVPLFLGYVICLTHRTPRCENFTQVDTRYFSLREEQRWKNRIFNHLRYEFQAKSKCILKRILFFIYFFLFI